MYAIKVILACIVCSTLLCSNITLAESLQETSDNFNIDTIEFREFFADALKRKAFLNSYILCLAAVRNDIAICNNLTSDEAEYCSRRFYRFNVFLRELAVTQIVSSKVINACIQSKGELEGCRNFAEGFLTKDSSMCSNMGERRMRDECKAIIAQKTLFCGRNQECRDSVVYMQALTAGDIQICNEIKTEDLKMLCRGNITMDENTCKQCDGFKKFIEQYHYNAIK